MYIYIYIHMYYSLFWWTFWKQTPRKEALELRLAEHYSHMMNFIRTRGEPILFYLPAKHNAETQKCLEETQRTIRRKIEMLPTHLRGAGDEEDNEAEDW